MNKITVNKIIGYKKWIPVEVIEGSDEHQELLRWNRAMNYVNKQDRKEMDKQNEIAENEISYEQKQEETGFELVDEDEPSPEEWFIQNEIKKVLWESVMDLPEHQRDIVILHFYKGCSAREIAKIKGINHSSVCKSIKSAVDKLREALREKNIF